MENIAPFDPYRLRSAGVEAPPQSLGGVFRRVGPGLILASAIVGSGELVASTVLGAENGYKLLWLILLSCVIKTVVQHELGRYTLATGETALEAFDRIPGPRLRVSWVVWLWLMMVIGTVLTMGGMLGGIAEVLHVLAPAVSINIWVWLISLGTVGLLIVGRYIMIERVAVGLVVSFTALTATGMFVLFSKPEYFSVDRALDGLLFQPPEGGLLTAVAVFGITGVAASELADVSLLVFGKRVRALHRPARGLGELAGPGAGLDSRYGRGCSRLVRHLYVCDDRVLPVGGRNTPRPRRCSARDRDGHDAVEHVYRDAGRLVAGAVSRRRGRGFLFECLCHECRSLPNAG